MGQDHRREHSLGAARQQRRGKEAGEEKAGQAGLRGE
jgi:hypothetical protein